MWDGNIGYMPIILPESFEAESYTMIDLNQTLTNINSNLTNINSNLNSLIEEGSELTIGSHANNLIMTSTGGNESSTGNKCRRYVVPSEGTTIRINTDVDTRCAFYNNITINTPFLVSQVYELSSGDSLDIVVPEGAIYLMVNIMGAASTVAVVMVDIIPSLKTRVENVEDVLANIDTNLHLPYATSGNELAKDDFTDVELLGRIVLHRAGYTSYPYINSVILNDRTIIAARTNGDVNKILPDGTTTTLINIAGADQWRGMFRSKKGDVFISPYHATDRQNNGIWKLNSDKLGFTQVHSWYDPLVADDATIWMFVEDKDGVIYAGVYDQETKVPVVYKSIDDGENWIEIINFNDYLGVTTIRHIHCIYYDKWNDALYVSAGEGDYNYKTYDKGLTWIRVCEGMGKMTAISSTPYCRIFGTDVGHNANVPDSDNLSAYILVTYDDVNFHVAQEFWSQNIFGFRVSDVTGWIYAYTLIDSSVGVLNYFPPLEALTDEQVLQDWIDSNPAYLHHWQKYNDKWKDIYPMDAIRPQHAGIACSKDGGITWEFIYLQFAQTGSRGFLYRRGISLW